MWHGQLTAGPPMFRVKCFYEVNIKDYIYSEWFGFQMWTTLLNYKLYRMDLQITLNIFNGQRLIKDTRCYDLRGPIF